LEVKYGVQGFARVESKRLYGQVRTPILASKSGKKPLRCGGKERATLSDLRRSLGAR
jgi:hypothetical protein